MAITYTVQARVVDIQGYRPRATDSFLVDTNVWFWAVYTSAPSSPTTPKHYQLNAYPTFLKDCKVATTRLLWSPVAWIELARLIEHTEHQIARSCGAAPEQLKEWRHSNPSERIRVSGEIKDAWEQIQAIAGCIGDLTLSDGTIKTAMSLFSNVCLDPADLFLAQSVTSTSEKRIITDDGDFCTVPGITMFTANRSVIAAAKAQSKLVQA